MSTTDHPTEPRLDHDEDDDRLVRELEAQGLPEKIEDPDVLDQVARILARNLVEDMTRGTP